ncbi:MAG TPA: hypothetical protein VFK10_17335 [Burkholderiaceae bacterium]|nr:hypothetical protein [Burkholderiaceae bacterium]
MSDVSMGSKELSRAATEVRPQYEAPRITVMSDEEVLKAFQMTAVEISAAGCWWMTGGSGG